MAEIYDEDASPEEHAEAMQILINNGTAWHFEGAVGREAMDLLDAGHCMLPQQAYRDAYGNRVPSRDDLEPGTKGTYQWVAINHGEEYAERMAKAGSAS